MSGVLGRGEPMRHLAFADARPAFANDRRSSSTMKIMVKAGA